MSSTLRTRDVATTNNGNVSLYRLTNAGLVEVLGDGEIVIGPSARHALQLAET